MAEVKARTYGGETGDERVARRRSVLLDAAFALVAEQGWRALRIETLCREAGLNKRYFYESFESLDAVVGALMQRLADEAIAVTLAAMDPDAPAAEMAEQAIPAFVAHLTNDPRRARVLFGAVPAGDAAAEHRDAALRHVIATAAATGRTTLAIADAPVVELAAAMLVGGTSQAVLDWLDGRVDCDRDAFVADLGAMWQAIIDLAAARAPR